MLRSNTQPVVRQERGARGGRVRNRAQYDTLMFECMLGVHPAYDFQLLGRQVCILT